MREMNRNAVINIVLLVLAILIYDLGEGIPQMIGAVLGIIWVLRLVLAVRKSKKSEEEERKKW